MIVAQLIEKLKAMPQSLEVERADCIPIKDVYVEGWRNNACGGIRLKIDDVIQIFAYQIAKDAAKVTEPQGGEGIAYCMFLQIAAVMAYDGERLIRLLEQSDVLMPRELAQSYIDFLTDLLEATSGNLVTS